MGPQFSFKTYQNVQNTTVLSSQSSALLSQSPEVNLSNMDITSDEVDLESLKWEFRPSNEMIKVVLKSYSLVICKFRILKEKNL